MTIVLAREQEKEARDVVTALNQAMIYLSESKDNGSAAKSNIALEGQATGLATDTAASTATGTAAGTAASTAEGTAAGKAAGTVAGIDPVTGFYVP